MSYSSVIVASLIAYAERCCAILIVAGLLLQAHLFQAPGKILPLLHTRVTVTNVLLALLFIAGWTVCYRNLDADRAQGLAGALVFRRLVLDCALATGWLWVVLLIGQVRFSDPFFLPLFWIAAMLLVGARLAITRFVSHRTPEHRKQVVILGTGPRARQAWRELRTKHHETHQVIGFVDDRAWPASVPEIVSQYLGTTNDLEHIMLRRVVDVVVVALPAKSCYSAIQKAISICEQVGVDVLQFDSIFEMNRSSRPGSQVLAVMSRSQIWHDEFSVAAKRLLDIVVAGTALLALLPLLLVIAAAVRLTSSGPALFVQERYGFRRRKFRLLKFRTMVVNAEHLMQELEQHNEAAGPIFKIKNDPRITPLGKFLRKTSLDELPQLWNVFVGTMSLVGPRPMSVRDVSRFDSSYLMRRFEVKPGITGLWQVSGRSNVGFDRWIAMDFSYIDQWSLLLDMKIILRTFPAVLKGSGAM